MRGPLHPQLAHLERAYLTIRNEVANGKISASEAANVLRAGAIADREGNLWWVDFDSSKLSAEFFSDRTGKNSVADASEFKHGSAVAVPAKQDTSSAAGSTAAALFAETSSHPDSKDTLNAESVVRVASEDAEEFSALEKTAANLRKRLETKEQESRAYAGIQQSVPVNTTRNRQNFPKVFIVIPAIVLTFVALLALFAGDDSPQEAPAIETSTVETTASTVPGTQQELAAEDGDLQFDPESGMFVMPTG